LLVIDVVAASGVLIVQTVWATTADLRFGHRRTDIETIVGEAALMRRLTELVPVICGSGDMGPPTLHAAAERKPTAVAA
jgi:hypothetical protein